ncbi:hypothetical protein RclHR1_00740015 [Rhizophagus clarus]|uniref:Uncharacterized protein n=1 Tax=Rhizophagus clarus TaxID=94130 RepID=A0A2Z6SCY2_9GLOM|nr:hypothetical protein RclHR1_00740015 [Rhizophagus clarus]
MSCKTTILITPHTSLTLSQQDIKHVEVQPTFRKKLSQRNNEMANIIIFNFLFKDDNNGINDFSLNINTQTIQTVDDLMGLLVTGGHVTNNNFSLYRNNFAKDVKEHMKPGTVIRSFFPKSPDINQKHVLIHPNN